MKNRFNFHSTENLLPHLIFFYHRNDSNEDSQNLSLITEFSLNFQYHITNSIKLSQSDSGS